MRGIADAIENALLYYIISAYPETHNTIVNISSLFTGVKLGMIPIWGILLIIGILCNFIKIKPRKIGSVHL